MVDCPNCKMLHKQMVKAIMMANRYEKLNNLLKKQIYELMEEKNGISRKV